MALLRDQFPDVAPRDELDVVLLEHFAKGVAGEEVEVALAPGGAPIRMIRSGASHLRIVVSEMNHDLRHAGLEFAQRIAIETGPVLRRDARIDVEHAIDEDVVRLD